MKNFLAIPGKGLKATVNDKEVLIGNRALMMENHIDVNIAESYIYLAIAKSLAATIEVADKIKPEAKEVISKLKKHGIEVWMLTGDNEITAKQVAKEVGIENIQAEVLPQDKSAVIKSLQAAGKTVAMVGDGINDAPALAQADLGIAMGTGTDVAMAASDITIVSGSLQKIMDSLYLSKKTVKTIKEGLFWAFAYNVLLIPVAMGVLYPSFHYLLNPILAAGAMALSSVSVVLNALRLKKIKSAD